MQRLAGIAAALAMAAGCGTTVKDPSGPLGQYYMPTGIAVQRWGTAAAQARLLVVSSNSDLRYASATGGSVIALEGDFLTTSYRQSGAVNVQSFGGDLAIAQTDPTVLATTDPAYCGTAIPAPLAIFATRGSTTLNVVRIGSNGELDCSSCGLPLTGRFADPVPVIVACKPATTVTKRRASVYVGYLQGVNAEGWITEYDLGTGAMRNMDTGAGQVRGLAYDRNLDRLYLLGLATSYPTPLRYVDLAGCTLGDPPNQGGCAIGTVQQPATFGAVELRSMALAAPVPGRPQRAYLTGRLYDTSSALNAGARTTDLGGKLFVVDLVDGPAGLEVDLVDEVDVGHGAQEVRVLPRNLSWSASRDLLAVLSVDDAYLWLYDTETRTLASFGHDPVTGGSFLGGQPYGLAVDPLPIGGNARLYVGSYTDSYVIPFDVPLADPDPVSSAVYAGGHRILLTGAGVAP